MTASITDLHPDLQCKCRVFLDLCRASGLDARITHAYRSVDEQDRLYAQGRTTPGPKVTNVRGGASKHNFASGGKPASKAFDFGVFDRGRYVTDGSDRRYEQAGKIGEGLGLVWGGRWKSPFDPGHLELP